MKNFMINWEWVCITIFCGLITMHACNDIQVKFVTQNCTWMCATFSLHNHSIQMKIYRFLVHKHFIQFVSTSYNMTY